MNTRLVFYNSVAWLVIDFGRGLRCVAPMALHSDPVSAGLRQIMRGPMHYYGYGKLKREIDERLANGS